MRQPISLEKRLEWEDRFRKQRESGLSVTRSLSITTTSDEQLTLLKQLNGDVRGMERADDRRSAVKTALQSLGFQEDEIESCLTKPMEREEIIHQPGRYTLLSTGGKRFLLLTHHAQRGHPIIGEGYVNCIKFAIDLTDFKVMAVRIARNQPYGEGHPPPSETAGRKLQWETGENEYLRKSWDAVKDLLYKEADFQRKLAVRCPQIVPLLHFKDHVYERDGVQRETIYQILPYYETDWRKAQATASEQQILQWTNDVLMAIRHIHQQDVIHGDIHAGNLFIDLNDRAFLGDFGNAMDKDASMKDLDAFEDLDAFREVLFNTYSFGIKPYPKVIRAVLSNLQAWNIDSAIRQLK